MTLIDEASGATANKEFEECIVGCWSVGEGKDWNILISDSLMEERRWIPLPVRRIGAWYGRRQLASIKPGELLLRLRLTKKKSFCVRCSFGERIYLVESMVFYVFQDV